MCARDLSIRGRERRRMTGVPLHHHHHLLLLHSPQPSFEMQFLRSALGYSTGEGDEGEAQAEQRDPPQPPSGLMARGLHWVSSSVRHAASRLTGWDFTADEFQVVAPEEEDHGAEKAEVRSELWELLSRALGMDITHVTLPVWLFEPLSFLQRTAELTQYSSLLDHAAQEEDSLRRLAFVTAFVVAAHSTTERTAKPFNPYLGETFENIREDNRMHYIAEQVSHHPPVGASYATGPGWILRQESRVETKFRGNSVEFYPRGKNYLEIPKFEEIYSWILPTGCVHNVIIGRWWLDHYGDFEVRNHRTGERTKGAFKPSGWFGAHRYEVEGDICDGSGVCRLVLSGKWNNALVVRRVGGEEKEEEEEEETGGERSEETIWTVLKEEADGPFRFTPSTHRLNEMPVEGVGSLPPTDSRLRPDRKALEEGDKQRAATEKHRLEEKQRSEKRERLWKGEEWMPRWFEEVEDSLDPGTTLWEYTGSYWDRDRSHDPQLDVFGT